MNTEVDLQKYAKILIKWRSVIIFNMVCITLITVIASLVIPQKWTAKTTLLPPSEEGGSFGLSALLGGGLGGMFGGGNLSRILPGMATLSDLFAKELKSKRIMSNVIKKNDLMTLYKARLMEDALNTLDAKTTIEVSPEGIIVVAVTERNAELAAKIANSYVEELDRFNRDVNMTIGKKNRLFLEERLEAISGDLAEAEEALKVFKEKHKTVMLSSETSAAISALSEIRAQIMAYEVQLGMLYRYSSSSNPEIIRLQNEIAELKRKEAEIESKGKDSFGAGFSIPFSKLPEISLEMARKLRDVKVQEALFELVTQQFEQAKIMEVRDTPTVQVLDVATAPERRSFPQRKKMVIFAFLFSFFWGVGLSFALEYIASFEKKKPAESQEWKKMFCILKEDFDRFKIRKKRKQ